MVWPTQRRVFVAGRRGHAPGLAHVPLVESGGRDGCQLRGTHRGDELSQADRRRVTRDAVHVESRSSGRIRGVRRVRHGAEVSLVAAAASLVALVARGRRGRRRRWRRLAVHFHVLSQGARVRVALVAAADLAVVRLVRGVHVRVLLAVRAVGEPPVAALELAFERLLACVRSFVDLEVLGAREDLPAAWEGAGKGFLTRMHAYVVDQLILGLEGPTVPCTVLPEARVVRALGSPHVLHRQVRHDFVHGREALGAGLPRAQLLRQREVRVVRVRLDPQAGEFLLHGLSHVAEEGAVRVAAHRRRRVHGLGPGLEGFPVDVGGGQG